MRVVISGIVAVALIACLGADPPRKFPPGIPETVPDDGWKCEVGARGTILKETIAASKVKLPAGTEIVVVRYVPPYRPSRPNESATERDRAIVEAIMNPPPPLPAVVRVLSGPHEGKEFDVFDNEIGVMIPNPRPWFPLKPGETAIPWDVTIPLALDPASYAAIRRDPAASTRLIARGKAFRVKADALVSVVEPFAEGMPGTGAARVRIVTPGPHKGKVGLIYRGNLIPLSQSRPSPP